MNKDKFMDEAIIALLKSMQEFSEAWRCRRYTNRYLFKGELKWEKEL